MKKKEIQDKLQLFIPELFNFSYALIPDDLQSTQIVVDIFHIFFLRETDLVKKLLDSHYVFEEESFLFREVKLKLYFLVYKIGKKRVHQLLFSENFLNDIRQSLLAFYRLRIEERVILYLWDKMKDDEDLISYVTGLPQSEILPMLIKARTHLTQELELQKTFIKGELFARESSFD